MHLDICPAYELDLMERHGAIEELREELPYSCCSLTLHSWYAEEPQWEEIK